MSVAVSAIVEALERAGVSVEGVAGGAAGGAAGTELGALRVAGVQHDSRRVGPSDLYVAWAGEASDGHDYVASAARAGAGAAIVERIVPDVTLPQLRVDNARLAAAVAAERVAGSPWKSLRTVGVTGTNGKTTVAMLLRDLLARRESAAAIGTLGLVGPTGKVKAGTRGLTTPGPVEVTGWLSSLVRSGVASVVMETSSHALDQYRLDGVRFDVAAFTNLTRDHLDYHGTQASYFAAKARLLELGKPGFTAVVNADDPAWEALRPSGVVLSYGTSMHACVRARDVRLSLAGSTFDMVWDGRAASVALPLSGEFNVSNALCAAACALALGTDLNEVAEGLSAATPVPGRLERILDEPFEVIVDFAHTPDALEQVLKTLRPMVRGRLIVVFGAGGDRERTKRSLMGAAVARGADVAVVTSDNPRTEDPEEIVAQIAAGAAGAQAEIAQAAEPDDPAARLVKIVDRREAIRWALDAAKQGDAVLLAGKGHETVQEVGGEKLPFDERQIVRELLAERVGR